VVPGVYPGEPDFQTLTGTGTNPYLRHMHFFKGILLLYRQFIPDFIKTIPDIFRVSFLRLGSLFEATFDRRIFRKETLNKKADESSKFNSFGLKCLKRVMVKLLFETCLIQNVEMLFIFNPFRCKEASPI
jgi:hypothetical protein